MGIAERIKNRRVELGLSVKQVADSLGVNQATVYRYESSFIEKMPITVIEPLAKVLLTTPEYLMGWEDDAISDVTIDQALIATYGGEATPEQIEKIKDYIAYVMKKKG